MVDHLSRLELLKCESDKKVQINDTFSDEKLLAISQVDFVPWYVDIVNYLVIRVIPLDFPT